MDQLEEIDSLKDCQSACEYTINCSYFKYDVHEKICSLNTGYGRIRNCDITIGAQSPDFQTCADDGKIEWATNNGNEIYTIDEIKIFFELKFFPSDPW